MADRAISCDGEGNRLTKVGEARVGVAAKHSVATVSYGVLDVHLWFGGSCAEQIYIIQFICLYKKFKLQLNHYICAYRCKRMFVINVPFVLL